MQTGMWTARGSAGDSRLAPVRRAPRDIARKTCPLHSSEESSGRLATWLGGREETRLPQTAWERARQDPSIVRASVRESIDRGAPGTVSSDRLTTCQGAVRHPAEQ